jgi:hypothetical protein
VNWSALLGALAPLALDTVMSIASPAPLPAPGGATAVIEVGELTVNDVAWNDPNATPVTSVKFVPVIVTDVPPVADPLDGLIAVTLGAASRPLADHAPPLSVPTATSLLAPKKRRCVELPKASVVGSLEVAARPRFVSVHELPGPTSCCTAPS